MNALIDRNFYALVGTGVLIVYFALVLVFLRQQTRQPNEPVQWWWHLLIGPPALLKWYSNRLGRRILLSRRETVGWLVVIALMVIVVVWKLANKSL
jgi:hypothetical protein